MEKIWKFESNIKNQHTKESQNFSKISKIEVPKMSRKQSTL